MRKIISIILTAVIISSSTFVINRDLFVAKAQEASVRSFLNEAADLIRENDTSKNFVVDSELENEVSTFSTDSIETENYDFQTCRLIVRSNKKIDKLDSIGVASGFENFYIVQFASEDDAKSAFKFYSESDYVISVSPDRVYNAVSDYSVDGNNELTYESDVPERLESWGSEITGTYDLIDYIESNYDISVLPEIIVAVMDSGVDLNHEFLQGRLISTGYNLTTYGQPNSEHDVIFGHGTNVASVIADNTTSNVKIKSYRIVGDDGKVTASGIALSIIEAYTNGVNIVNFSLGFPCPTDSEYEIINSAIENAINCGCLIVASSGNNNVDIDYYSYFPASVDSVITVAASNIYNTPTSWSSRGDSVNVMAPGDNIPVAAPNDKYKLTSGTSFSSPLTAAVLALLKTLYPEESLKQLEVRLESTADECDLAGVVNMYGYGIIDAIGAAGLARTEPPIIKNEFDVYEGIAEIEISVPENSVVYYTMDQTYPSEENGILYTEPIVIEDDLFRIHAVAYSDDGLRSDYASELVRAATLGTDDMFEIDEDGTVTAYYGDVNYLQIPNSINGISVTGFADGLFSEANLYGVLFSDKITTITTNLFCDNSTLQYADGLGITEIQTSAFNNCTNLYEINFPNVLSIGKRAFYNTRQLSGIDFPKCTYINQYAFYDSVIRYINLPKVETICAYAFNDCDCIYELNIPLLDELRERLSSSNNTYYGGGYSFWNSCINTVVDLKNITDLPFGCFYKSQVKRLEFSNIKTIADLPITYCKQPFYGTITVALPSTLESCDIDDIPSEDKDLVYKINYKVYCSEGTYAQQWAEDNGYEIVILNQENANEALISDLPDEYYSYMRPLEADVVGFNRTYQWYGSETSDYKGVAIKGATEKKFNPDEFTKEYKYYYCVVTSTDVGYDSIEIKTGICENKTYNPYNPPKSNGKVTIATPSNRYIQYGESIKLYANATGLPEGAKIKWRIVEGSGVSLDVSTTGKICTVTSKYNGNVIIEAYAVNAQGNVLVNESGNRICDREGITSEVNLWLIIVYYIKQMFSITNTSVNLLL